MIVFCLDPAALSFLQVAQPSLFQEKINFFLRIETTTIHEAQPPNAMYAS